MENNVYRTNQLRLGKLLNAGAIAVINSNDVLPTNADGTYPYKQNNDIYYLTGIQQEQTILVLYPDAPKQSQQAMLFIQPPNEEKRKWFGHQLSQEEAAHISGVTAVHTLDEFPAIFQELMSYTGEVYLNRIEHSRAQIEISTRDDRFGKWCREKYPLHRYNRLAPIMARLRVIKQPYEIELMKRAAEITGAGFMRVLKRVKPGIHQKQVEAEMIHEYLQHQASWADYQPIVASGRDTCILHYNTNHQFIKAGELVLIDAACSFHGYQSDVTRTIPADGHFTARQLEIYHAVLAVHRFMSDTMKQGVPIATWQMEGKRFCAAQLRELNIRGAASLNDEALMNAYAYHGFSHYLGLDVHDVGNLNDKLEYGMLLTNEPGIYIEEEGLGIRLENNLLLTATGVDDITAHIPIEADAITTLMNG